MAPGQIIFKDFMSTYEKILSTIHGLDIFDKNDFLLKDLILILEIVNDNDDNLIFIKTSTDLRKTLRELYDKDNMKKVDIHRIVNVNKANNDWERSDFACEIINCLTSYKTEGLSYGFYEYVYLIDILDFFDKRLEKDNFDEKYIFTNEDIFIKNIDDDDGRLSPYIFNCVGKNCKNMTNGSQYCRKIYCETEALENVKSDDEDERPKKVRRVDKYTSDSISNETLENKSKRLRLDK